MCPQNIEAEAPGTGTSILRTLSPAEAELERLRDHLAALRRELAARELTLSSLRGQLFSFEGRYIRQVGKLYKQLDEWEQRIAELHGRTTASSEEAELEGESQDEIEAPKVSKAATPASLKVLFRELAKRIHPDFAADADDERRRTRLMSQANDALKRRDHRVLQRMLHGFDVAEELATLRPEAELAVVRASMDELIQDIASAEAELKALAASDLARLRMQALEAALQGRDLLAEMAARVKGRIGLAMRQYELDLDRKSRPAAGPSVETLVTAETSRASSARSRTR